MRYILYGKKKQKADIIKEDETHILVEFEDGTKIATDKNLHKIYEIRQQKLF